MTDRTEVPGWLAYYHSQIDARNQSQSSAFRELIRNYGDVMEKCMALQKERVPLAVSAALYAILPPSPVDSRQRLPCFRTRSGSWRMS